MSLIIKNKSELLRKLKSLSSKKINFIPTMGNLHDGHISLIKKAKKSDYLNLVSIYINPLQFNDKHDLKKYPRTIKEDIVKLKKIGVDIVFIPNGMFNDTNSFTIYLDPFNNRRSGYYFQVNPNGATADAVFSDYRQLNRNWEGIWEARATINDRLLFIRL